MTQTDEQATPLTAEEFTAWAATIESAAPTWETDDLGRQAAVEFSRRIIITIDALSDRLATAERERDELRVRVRELPAGHEQPSGLDGHGDDYF